MDVTARCGVGTLMREREFFIDNLLVLIHFIVVMIRWTGLAPWEFEFPFPGSLTSTFLGAGNPFPFESSTILYPEWNVYWSESTLSS